MKFTMINISCPCNNGNLTEIPSGEDSQSYECSTCGRTIFIQFIKPENEPEEVA